MRYIIIFSLVALSTSLFGQRPNVLLIISDDLNTRIGPYMEIDKHTPNLDRLAAEGIRFTRAYSQYPICGPSRASLMSGLYPETNGIKGNSYLLGSYRAATPALASHPSLAGYFREQGYYTARVSKIFHMGVPGGIERGEAGGDDPDSWDYAYNVLGPETHSHGILELLSPKNLHYGSNFSRMIIPNTMVQTQTDYMAASQAIAILENRADDLDVNSTSKQKEKPTAPFFLGVGLVRPHVPFIAPENCFEPYPADDVVLPPVVVNDTLPTEAFRRQNMKIWGMNEVQKKKTISAYMASVRFMDQQVGRLLDALDRLGIRNETIVVFISDHGYNLGEHDCWSKISLWEGSVRVPMIISSPGAENARGITSNSIVELIDLYPTLTELCGIDQGQPGILQGKSLAGYIEGKKTRNAMIDESPSEKASDGPFAYSITYGGRAATIRTERWRYTVWGEEMKPGKEELYDHRDDPEEHFNLAGDPTSQPTLEELRKTLNNTRKMARSTPETGIH